VLDPETGATRSEGRGELVVTSLFREAMPLVRYRLEDVVEISRQPCPCGWKLPTVRVSGRANATFAVGGRRLFPVDLEQAVFSLPFERRVLFWRARCSERSVDLEIEAAAGQEEKACRELEEGVFARTEVRARVLPVPAGRIVPDSLLTASAGFRKPRFVFGADEDWSAAVAY
jgi:phenylacetate-CoA ligase